MCQFYQSHQKVGRKSKEGKEERRERKRNKIWKYNENIVHNLSVNYNKNGEANQI